LHIGSNVYVLVLLGRLLEPWIGKAHFAFVYMVAGAAGSLASMLFGRGLISVGASGAIFGLLGAFIVTLLVSRRRMVESVRRTLLKNLLLLVTLEIVVDWQVELVDNAAHLGGLCGGMVAGLFAASAPQRDWAARVARGIGWIAAASLLAYGAVGVAAADPAALGAQLPRSRARVGRLLLTTPGYWRRGQDGVWDDPLAFSDVLDVHELEAQLLDGAALEQALQRRVDGDGDLRAEPPAGLGPPGSVEAAVSYIITDAAGRHPTRVLEIEIVLPGPPGRVATLRFHVPFERRALYAPIVSSVAASLRFAN
jgi:hypothetical protein